MEPGFRVRNRFGTRFRYAFQQVRTTLKLVSWGDMKYKQGSEGGALVDVGGAQVEVGECGGKRYTGPQRTFKKACWSSNLVYTGGRDSILLILEYVIMKSC